jgi:hypothetical protein
LKLFKFCGDGSYDWNGVLIGGIGVLIGGIGVLIGVLIGGIGFFW